MRKRHLLFFILTVSTLISGCATTSLKQDSCDSRTPSSAGLRCEQVFESEKTSEPIFSLNSEYDHLGIEELRLGPAQNGSYPLLRKKVYRIAVQNAFMISQIAEPGFKAAKMNFANTPASAVMLKGNQASWNDIITEAMDFVLNQYAERREHWPASFREKLRKMADDYKFNSTYITVKHQTDPTDVSSVLGTLRLIEERDGRLPMEDYLGISINSQGAKKYEPGNFAINKSVNQYAFGEILVHLIESTLEKSKKQESHFYTYADRQSLMMYKMLGFRPLAINDLHLSPGVEVDARGRIKKNDVLWTPLEASRQDLEALLANYLSGELQTHGTTDIREVMKLRHQAVDTKVVFQDHIFRGQVSGSTINTEPCALYMRPEDGKWTFLFGRTNNKSLMFRGWESFSIPNKSLKEGYHHEQDTLGVREVITYKQGVLTYQQLDGSGQSPYVVYQIKISPDLSTVESLKADYNPGTSFHSEFSASF